MSWLRLDDGFASHPKIAQLTDAQHRVWIRVLCYCARYEDPTVDEHLFDEVSGLNRRRFERFIELELLDKSGASWVVHDWERYQPKDKTGAERQAKWRARHAEARNGGVTVDTVTGIVTSRDARSRPQELSPHGSPRQTAARETREAEREHAAGNGAEREIGEVDWVRSSPLPPSEGKGYGW